MFSQWLNAYDAGNTRLAGIYVKRFRDEFRPAFDAWMATDPFNNPDAPRGPLYMVEYVSADGLRAEQLDQQAGATVEAGEVANESGDQYVLNTVFLAAALFLAGIAGRFNWLPSRIAILAISVLVLGLGIINIIRLPID